MPRDVYCIQEPADADNNGLLISLEHPEKMSKAKSQVSIQFSAGCKNSHDYWMSCKYVLTTLTPNARCASTDNQHLGLHV